MLTRSFSYSALRRPLKRMLAAKMSTGERQNVCIIGGGFGGLYTAIKLSQMKETKDKLNIHLFDPKDKFVFLPLLYELAVGSASVVEVQNTVL